MNDERPMKKQPPRDERREELRQQLWELAYGLLEADAEAALRTQIKSDPAVARLYSEVRLQADLVGRAARVEDSSLHISAGPEAKVSQVTRHSRTAAGKAWQQTARRLISAVAWPLLCSCGGWFAPWVPSSAREGKLSPSPNSLG